MNIMIKLIESLIYLLGSVFAVGVLVLLLVLLIKFIFGMLKYIKKVDFAWCIVMSAKRRHETAEEVIDDIIGICRARSGIRLNALTDKQRKDIKRVLERLDSH
jgi:hypothetical protein